MFVLRSNRCVSDVTHCAVDAAVAIGSDSRMDTNMEKDCVILEEFFQQIILDMKVIGIT